MRNVQNGGKKFETYKVSVIVIYIPIKSDEKELLIRLNADDITNEGSCTIKEAKYLFHYLFHYTNRKGKEGISKERCIRGAPRRRTTPTTSFVEMVCNYLTSMQLTTWKYQRNDSEESSLL